LTTIFIDCETYTDRKSGYDLRSLSLVEYVRHPRFKLHGVGIAVDEDQPVWLRPGQTMELRSYLARAQTVVAHNAKFDVSALCRLLGGWDAAWLGSVRLVDTKGLCRAVLGKRVEDYSLKTLAAFYELEPKGELKTDGLRDLDEETENELATYCLHDVELCRSLFNQCWSHFPSSQADHLDWTIRSFCSPKLVVNTGVLEHGLKEEKERKARVFEEIGLPTSEFSSNVRFAKLLSTAGVVVPEKVSTRTGEKIPALSVGDSAFLDLLESRDERVRKLCEARVEAKSTILETRCQKLLAVGHTGPWPFDVEFSGAAQTHRYSGGGGAAGNPQNFVRDSVLREAVCAPPGYALVVGDFAAIEMRLVAYLANDPGLIRAIEGNKDVYCEFASAFYRRPITKADKAERWFGKTAILGLGYGMGPKKFLHTVRIQTGQRISEADAVAAVRLYRSRYWRVPQLWSFLDSLLPHLASGASGPMGSLPVRMVGGNIILPSGLVIQYPNLRKIGTTRRGKIEWGYDEWTKKGQKEPTKLYGGKLLENITQALAGELAKEANRPFIADGSLVGVVHDETILCVPARSATAAKIYLQRALEHSPGWLPRLRLACEVGVGPNWKSAKK
jgi:DNA polymerase